MARPGFLLLLLAFLLASLAACSANPPGASELGGPAGETGDDAPGPPPPPDSWEVNDEAAYRASVDPDWLVTFLTEGEIDALADPERLGGLDGLGIDPATVAQAMSSLRLEGLFVASLGDDGLPNISAMWCLPAAAIPRDLETALAVYELSGTEAEHAGSITYAEGETFLVRVELREDTVSYHASFPSNGCYVQIALLLEEDDPAVLDEFRAFVGSLEARRLDAR